jgi:hypothetical protein
MHPAACTQLSYRQLQSQAEEKLCKKQNPTAALPGPHLVSWVQMLRPVCVPSPRVDAGARRQALLLLLVLLVRELPLVKQAPTIATWPIHTQASPPHTPRGAGPAQGPGRVQLDSTAVRKAVVPGRPPPVLLRPLLQGCCALLLLCCVSKGTPSDMALALVCSPGHSSTPAKLQSQACYRQWC